MRLNLPADNANADSHDEQSPIRLRVISYYFHCSERLVTSATHRGYALIGISRANLMTSHKYFCRLILLDARNYDTLVPDKPFDR